MIRIYEESRAQRENELNEETEDQQMMVKEENDVSCEYVMSIKFKNDLDESEKNLN